MERRTVELQVGGQRYKVVSSASEDDLRRLATTVDERVSSSAPRGRAAGPQALVLAAIALAHDLEEERQKRLALEARTRDVLRRVLVRVDHALDEDSGAEPGPTGVPGGG